MSGDEPIRLYFSIAPLQSAMTRAHDGGARVKIDIPQSSMAELNRLMDIATASGGVTFAAVVLPLESGESLTELDDAPTQNAERSAPLVDRRRSANRRNQ